MNGMTDKFPPDDIAGLIEGLVSGQRCVFPPSTQKAGVGGEISRDDGAVCGATVPHSDAAAATNRSTNK
jgi:hypothetical protein